MDKKDLNEIAQVVNTAVETSHKKLKEELRQELSEEIKTSIERQDKKIENLSEQLLDRMFLFEQEYGQKIDVIFDISLAQKDKVDQLYKEQEIFRKRTKNLDTKYFNLKHRVFKLEHEGNS